ncbi:hypothetical protein BH09PAT4_BH09PAT4_06440 [soil metagenome]
MTEHIQETIQTTAPLDEQIEEAQLRLRAAHHAWGVHVGVFEPELHDLDGPRAQQALHDATIAGNQLSRLLDLRPKPEQSVATQGLGKTLKRFLGR